MTRAEELPDIASAKEFYEKYEPKEILGVGVSSTVRRCINRNTRQEYAVKIIDIIGNDDILAEDLVNVTHNEINILRRVSSRAHIIELVDVFETSTFFFLIFEILRKGELFDYLTEVVKFSERQTRTTMRDLLEAVLFLHDNKIIHRDLKPENILLNDDLKLHLSDFGFAIELDDGEYLKELCGTPGYMSPEMLKCTVDPRHPGYRHEVDMWACGVVMYTLLAGVPPFWHRRQIIMFRRIMEGQYSFPSPDWDDISDSSKDLIQRFLTVSPTERITAEEALRHPFFDQVDQESRYYSKAFNAKRKFRVAILTVIATSRIVRQYHNPRTVRCSVAAKDPYSVKLLRRLIDASAFGIYGHWVKKAADQNRIMLFENCTRMEQLQQAKFETEYNSSPEQSPTQDDEDFDTRLRRVSTSLSFENASYAQDIRLH
uniref:phosphorylase kinase n=1 Tax=Halocynthia roretzi TaxID=7729 RepID=Q9BLG2_HALRO|nr:phosphorylase kinase B gamma subunit [Halocynthia roretzi]